MIMMLCLCHSLEGQRKATCHNLSVFFSIRIKSAESCCRRTLTVAFHCYFGAQTEFSDYEVFTGVHCMCYSTHFSVEYAIGMCLSSFARRTDDLEVRALLCCLYLARDHQQIFCGALEECSKWRSTECLCDMQRRRKIL